MVGQFGEKTSQTKLIKLVHNKLCQLHFHGAQSARYVDARTSFLSPCLGNLLEHHSGHRCLQDRKRQMRMAIRVLLLLPPHLRSITHLKGIKDVSLCVLANPSFIWLYLCATMLVFYLHHIGSAHRCYLKSFCKLTPTLQSHTSWRFAYVRFQIEHFLEHMFSFEHLEGEKWIYLWGQSSLFV